MNKNAPDIIQLVNDLVDAMTPVVEISSIEADGDNWKLNTCNTYWLTPQMKITIDSVEYTVLSFVQNEYIIVSGDEPTVDYFQLSAPVFEHGASRKVNKERTAETSLDVRYKSQPFVYLPVPRTVNDNDDESSYAYVADIRPIFFI